MKTRKQLPNFGFLDGIRIDVNALLAFLKDENMLDFSQYNDIKYSSNSPMAAFVKGNFFSKNNFFKEEDAESLEGDKYRQLYLTEYKYDQGEDSSVDAAGATIFSRTKRLNPRRKEYTPEVDELNYGKFTNRVSGLLKTVIEGFGEDQITRVRLAVIDPHFEIKAHVDYDPSYIVRYHIPLITNEDCTLTIYENGGDVTQHFPADGRVYFINAGKKHSAKNNSDMHRLHLIIDVHGQNMLNKLVAL